MKDVKVLCMRNKVYGFLAFILIFLSVAVSCAVSVDDPSVVYVPVSSGSGNPSFQGGGGTDGILEYGREGQDLDLQFNVSYPCVRSALPSDISALFSNPDVKFKASISKAGAVIANSTASKIVETALGVTTYKLAFSFPGFVSLYTTTYKITISLNDSETDAKLMETDEFEVTVAPNVKAYEDTANTYFLYPAADNALGPKGSLTLQVKSASDFSLDVSGLPAGVSVSSASGIHSIEGTDITPGNYEVLFTLSKDGNKVYSWKENIIVYSGLETNRWSSNSPSDPDPDSKDLTVLGRTEFYVRSATGATGSLWTTFSSDAGDDTDGDGSIKKPYATVQKAINTAKSLASTYAVQPEFTVYCDGSFGAYSGNTSASVIEVNTGVNDLRIIGLGSSRAEFNGTGVTKSVLFNSQKLYLENIWVKNGTYNSGGGMYLMGPTTMKNCRVSDCVATGSSAMGGGILIVSSGVLKILEGVEICDNNSERNGGGIYVNSGGSLDICADFLLSGNEMATSGAGIYVVGNIKANGALIVNGLHPGLDHISGINGGDDVYHVSKNFMRINDPDLTDPDNNICRLYEMLSHINAPDLNVCLGKSDATETVFEINDELSLPEFDMTLMCTSFSESANKKSNRAVIKGYRIKFLSSSDKNYTLKGIKVLGSSDSGIYISSNNVNLIYCDIESCEGSVGGFGGGGVYMEGGSLTMSYGSITGCSAPKGGALVMLHDADVSLADVIVSGNTATGSGSGIDYESGTLKLSGSTVITPDNDVYILSGKTITVESNLTGDCPVATITPSSYFPSNQVLASNAYLAGNYMKFAVTKQAGVKWKVVLTGSINRCSDDVCDLPSAPANGTYYVYDQEGLEKLSEWVADGNTLQTCTFRLGNDIYARGDFKPIGGGAAYNSNPFKGEFDGQDYTISGIDLRNVTNLYKTVFGTVSGGKIENLCVEGVSIQGGLVGVISGTASIENCINRIAINGDKNYSAGIACSQQGGTIKNCINEANITSSRGYTGGIVGYTSMASGIIDGCINKGQISGTNRTGGIVGDCFGNIRNCQNIGNVVGENYVGGIVGHSCTANTNGTRNCQNKGTVYGNRFVGGIAGGINSSSYSLYMENTKNSGVVGRVSGDYSEFGSIFGGFGSTPITVYMKYNYYDNSVAPKTGTCSDLSAYPDAHAAVGYAPMSRNLDSAVSVNGISYPTGPVNVVLNAWVNVENYSPPNAYLTWNNVGDLIFP